MGTVTRDSQCQRLGFGSGDDNVIVSKSDGKPRVLTRIRRGRRGGSALELLLVLPIMLMLSFGVVDYGYYFYLKSTLQGAAQAGARLAIPSAATNANVTTAISNILTAAGLQSSGYVVTLSPTDVSTAAAGASVSVTITCTWANVGTHALSSTFGGISNTKQIVGVAVMRKESS